MKRDGNKTHSCFFFGENEGGGCGKKKASSPRLAFPLCLKIVVKQGIF